MTRTYKLIASSCVLISMLSIALPTSAQERGPAGTVTFSRADYDRLLDLASRQTRPPDGAPLPAVLTRTDIRARVAAGSVRATMTVDGEVFQSGAVKVPVISNATLLDARSNDRALPLIAEGNAHVAVVNGPATFSATLEWGSTLTTTPGRGSFMLPVPSAGSATATFDVPGEHSDLRVSPGLVIRRTSANGRTLIEATLDPGSLTQVWWTARETAPASQQARDARILADVKTLVTVGDADVSLLTLIDVTVVQGDPPSIDVQIPAGYELASVTGASLDRSEQQGNRVTLFVSIPTRRRHQFLLNLERPGNSGSFKLESGFATVPAAQRETGEAAVEGLGTVEISPIDVPGLRRMDVREVDPALASAARQSLLAAFRYQRGPSGVPALAVNVRRFPDAAVLAAIAERAVATTLVTSEGRALTEVSLWLRNRAQPFMKVALPPGASMLSVDVAGSPAKPVEGADGMRVPLLRPGFRPEGPYTVVFVYLHAGTPFAKKGEMQMTLPRMDVPVSVVEWELFVPDRYRVDRFHGSAIAANLVEPTMVPVIIGGGAGSADVRMAGGVAGGLPGAAPPGSGSINGRVTDSQGGAVPGATVNARIGGQTRTAVTDSNGIYTFSNLPSGPLTLSSELQGFTPVQRSLVFDQRGQQIDFEMKAGEVGETVTVQADAPRVDTSSSSIANMASANEPNRARDEMLRKMAERQANLDQTAAAPSVNVQNLQRRAAGVLPVRIDVPRAGSSHRFLKPLVIDEETVVSFRYRRR